MVSYSIYYSWQSDYDYSAIEFYNEKACEIPNEHLTQKDQIKKTLDWQAYNLGKKLKCNITVDLDTDDTPGMQPISDVVIKKIRNCHIFVCDLTPVTCINGSDGKRNKLMPNSNVMFELGIAISNLQPYQIIAIAHKNNENWIINELPLDISHRKILTFENTADLELILFSTLESSLRHYQSIEGKWARFRNKFTNMFKSSPSKENDYQRKQNSLYNSDVFFFERMASTFPGFRGLKMIYHEELHLFFKSPISNDEVSPMLLIDKFGRYPIKQFSEIENELFLIGNTEVSCSCPKNEKKHYNNSNSDVFVYRHPENQKLQFIFIINHQQKKVEYADIHGLRNYEINRNYKKVDHKNLVQEVQEYAICIDEEMKPFNIPKEIYEDISISDKIKITSLGRFEIRRRYLKKSILMIVPNYSIINEKIYNSIVKIISYYDNHVKFESVLENKIYDYFQTEISTRNEELYKMIKNPMKR